MPVYNPRTRLISFRLSEQEYTRLCALSSKQGAHSLADFIRTSVCWVMDNAHNGVESTDGTGFSSRSFGDLKSRNLQTKVTAGQTSSHFEALAGLLLALQWKAESLDQEVRQLITLLKTVEPAARGSILEVRQHVTSASGGPVAVLHESESGIPD